jgi:hypothetical protein
MERGFSAETVESLLHRGVRGRDQSTVGTDFEEDASLRKARVGVVLEPTDQGVDLRDLSALNPLPSEGGESRRG